MNRPNIIDEEYQFNEGIIISSTDTKGIITYANRKFCEITGYSKSELVGENHNMVRHPDMPKAIFKEVWETIASTKEWTGIVKNLRKDGLYYWVYSHISPIVNDNNIVMGYTAVRRPASENEVSDIIPKYRDLIAKEK
jgi:aerotaxis receptor